MKKYQYIIIGQPRLKSQKGATVTLSYTKERRRWLSPAGLVGDPGRHFFLTREEAFKGWARKTRDWPDHKFKFYKVERVL